MLYAVWIERVEDAVADEEGLQALADQAEVDSDLSAQELENVRGRCETYLENFDDIRQAKLLVAVDAADGAAEDDIPDFDLAYDFDRDDSPLTEAYTERLHPRGRAGKWIDVPDVHLRSEGVEDYRGSHTSPAREEGGSLDDPTTMFGGDDIYGPDGLRYYGSGGHDPETDRADRESLAVIRAARGKPNKMVTAYRAVPNHKTNAEKIEDLELGKREYLRRDIVPARFEYVAGSNFYEWASEQIEHLQKQEEVETPDVSIKPGDWVTLSRSYAKQHGTSNLGGYRDKTAFKIVSKKVRAGDLFTDGDLNEWGWSPPGAISEAAFAPQLHPRDRLGRWRESVGKLHTISKADVIAGKVPGFKHDDSMSRGIAAHMRDRENITIGPGGYQGEMLDPLLMSHEIGHAVQQRIFATLGKDGIDKIPEVQAFRGEGETMTRGVGYMPTYDNPFGASTRPEEMVADAYKELLFFGAGEQYEDDPGSDFVKPRVALLKLVAKTARELGLPDRRIYRYTKDGETLLIEGYAEVLHPRDRLGKWRDVPDVPRKRGDLMVGNALKGIYDGFSHNGVTAVVMGTGVVESTRRAYGIMLHDPGDGGDPITVGNFEHSVYPDEHGKLVIERDLINLLPDFRDRGFATAFYAHEEQEAHAYGVDRIELSASLETGGYTWARAGFEFQVDDYYEEQDAGRAHAVAALWDAYGWRNDKETEGSLETQVGQRRGEQLRALRKKVGEDAWAAFAAKFPSSQDVGSRRTRREDEWKADPSWFSYEHEVAGYGRDGERWEQDGHEMWLGKAFMLGAGWEGVKRLYPEVHGKLSEVGYDDPPCVVVSRVYQGWRAARRIHDSPDDITGDDEDGFWDAVEAALA